MSKRRKREYGEGAVYQRKGDGMWIGVLELGWVDGKRRRKTVSAKTEKAAWRKLDELKKEHERGLNLMEPSRTVGEWLDLWLSEVKAQDGTRPATLTLYRGLSDRYVKPVIGSVRLDKLKPTHIQRLVSATRTTDTSRGSPPSASTLRHVHTLIRNALNDAYRMELVTRNVAAQVKAPPIPRKRREDLTVEGAKRLLDVLHGERLEALFVLALATGLRRGELLGLHWRDVDMEGRELRVTWALQRVQGRLQFVDLKTESSERTVSIPKFAVPYLKRHRTRQRRERLALGDGWQEHGLVFASSIGTPIEPRNVTRRWETLRDRADLGGLRLHDLRHGCATFMHAAGVPARTIMEVLGHSEIAVTMNTYTHVVPELRREAADALDELFGDAG